MKEANSDLFNENMNGAEFSECGKYRYALWRIWDDNKPFVMFIGLNPSTANESLDDPTIRRVKKFAFDWGYGGVYMMNLFAFVTPYPNELKECKNPLGDNDEWIEKIALKCEKIIFAWGSFPEAEERAKNIMKKFEGYALLINNNGSPRHPLYVPKNIKLIPMTI